jgi:hypothetical protein
MNNYSWLFDLDVPRHDACQPAQLMPDLFPVFPLQGNTVNQLSHSFDLQLDHMSSDKTLSTAAHHGSLPSERTDSPQQLTPDDALITPPLTNARPHAGMNLSTGAQPPPGSAGIQHPIIAHISQVPQREIERPLSLLYPSRSLPIIDELARQQILDLIDITQPIAPDGSLVMRVHPLLSLSCLQTYCDLFFTRFNSIYPLIHLSTFDPSHVDTLLLAAVLLLGATYGEKDAHQLAVRPLPAH